MRYVIIADRARLTVMPTAKFAAWFNIEIRTETEAMSIDRVAMTVTVKPSRARKDDVVRMGAMGLTSYIGV